MPDLIHAAALFVAVFWNYRFVGGGAVTVDFDRDGEEDLGRTARFLLVTAALLGLAVLAHEAAWKPPVLREVVLFVAIPTVLHLLWRFGEIGHLYCDPPHRDPSTFYGRFLLEGMGGDRDNALIARTAVQAGLSCWVVAGVLGLSGFVTTTSFAFFGTVYVVTIGAMVGMVVAYTPAADRGPRCIDVPRAERVAGFLHAAVSAAFFFCTL
jgi:hypothetical protein